MGILFLIIAIFVNTFLLIKNQNCSCMGSFIGCGHYLNSITITGDSRMFQLVDLLASGGGVKAILH